MASCGDVNADQGNSDFEYLEETEETWIHAPDGTLPTIIDVLVSLFAQDEARFSRNIIGRGI